MGIFRCKRWNYGSYTQLFTKKDKCFVLDCRTENIVEHINYLEWPNNLANLVIINTNVKHDLVGTPYNDRRNTTEKAAQIISKQYNNDNITHLRDVNIDMLHQCKDILIQKILLCIIELYM